MERINSPGPGRLEIDATMREIEYTNDRLTNQDNERSWAYRAGRMVRSVIDYFGEKYNSLFPTITQKENHGGLSDLGRFIDVTI